MKALFPLKTSISMYFIPDVLSFWIASVFIFITLSCSGFVTLFTQLWREVSLLSRLHTSTTHIAPFLSTGLESSADTLPLGGSDIHSSPPYSLCHISLPFIVLKIWKISRIESLKTEKLYKSYINDRNFICFLVT